MNKDETFTQWTISLLITILFILVCMVGAITYCVLPSIGYHLTGASIAVITISAQALLWLRLGYWFSLLDPDKNPVTQAIAIFGGWFMLLFWLLSVIEVCLTIIGVNT